MSRTPLGPDEQADPLAADFMQQFEQMLKHGRSFSGRERNCAFLNTGGPRFATVSAVTGLDYPDDARGLAVTDWDRDGRLDFWFSNRTAPRLRFLRNVLPADANWLAVKLVGNGSSSNRDAVGARVSLQTTTGRPLLAEVTAGSGFLSQSSRWLHFGLGAQQGIVAARIRWPDGSVDAVILPPRQRTVVEQGQPPRLTADLTPAATMANSAPAPQPQPATDRVRALLPQPLLLPRLTYRSLAGATLELPDRQPVLVNLWASWCAPCLAELKAFAAAQDALHTAGLQLAAWSLDELAGQQGSRAAAEAIAKRLQLPFEVGFPTAQALSDLEQAELTIIPTSRPNVVPTSFLLDGRGQLVALYKGSVDLQQLLADLSTVLATPRDPIADAALLPGRHLRADRVEQIALQATVRNHTMMAAHVQAAARQDEVIRYSLQLQAIDPTFAFAWRELGKVYLSQGELAAAAAQLLQAAQLQPNDAETQLQLARLHLARGELDAAAERLEQALVVDPKYSDAYNNLGNLRLKQGRAAAARQAYQAALQLQPQHALAHYNYGLALWTDEQYEDGLQAFLRAVELDDTFATGFQTLGLAYAQLGRFHDAEQALQRVLQLQPDNQQAADQLKAVREKR